VYSTLIISLILICIIVILIYIIVGVIVFVKLVSVFSLYLLYASVSFVVCIVLFPCGVLFCVMYDFFVLCLIVVLLPPGKIHFQFK
jgi:hypothetical protein